MKNIKVTRSIFSVVILIALVTLDQGVKHWSRLVLSDKKTIEVIPGLFNLTYVENRGAAFGMLQNATWFFSLVTIGVVVFIAYYLFSYSLSTKIKSVLLLILAGAIGNLIDRLRFGFVTDMLDFHGIWKFVFNVADIYVVTGTCLLILLLFIEDKKSESK